MQHNMTEEVWRRIKAWADAYASSGEPLPDDEECALAARRIAQQVYGGPAMPEDALEFYATEACAMVTDMRKAYALREAQAIRH